MPVSSAYAPSKLKKLVSRTLDDRANSASPHLPLRGRFDQPVKHDAKRRRAAEHAEHRGP